jgi:hypothetical protein
MGNTYQIKKMTLAATQQRHERPRNFGLFVGLPCQQLTLLYASFERVG